MFYCKVISFQEKIAEDEKLHGLNGFIELIEDSIHQSYILFYPNTEKAYFEMVDECFPALNEQDKKIMVDVCLSLIRYTDLTTDPSQMSKKAKNILNGLFSAFSLRDDDHLVDFGEKGLELFDMLGI